MKKMVLRSLVVMEHQRLLPEYRIRRGEDFQRAYARRCSASDGCLLLFGCQNDLPYPRLGLSVSRKVGNAVVRNLWKRRIREAFRLTRSQLPVGFDWVAIPRAKEPPTVSDLKESFLRLTKRTEKKLAR